MFSRPISFLKAIAEMASKKLVPTWLGSAELRALDSQVKQRALFQARNTQLRALQKLSDVVKGMLSGESNLADAKLGLGGVLGDMGYSAERGFPQDPEGTVPPGTPGTLTDLASQRRMELAITTQYRSAANAAFTKTGMEDQRRYQWPCWELVRIGRRRVPRGMQRRDGMIVPDPGQDWPSRWVAAGGELYDRGTRMIAAKDSPVWQALGDGVGGYRDTLGQPYAPFAFGSGFGLREVARNECLLLGVIEPEDKIAKMPVSLSDGLKADAKGLDPKLLEKFKKTLLTREDGSVRLKRMLDAEISAATANSLRGRLGRLCDLANMRPASRLQRRCRALANLARGGAA